MNANEPILSTSIQEPPLPVGRDIAPTDPETFQSLLYAEQEDTDEKPPISPFELLCGALMPPSVPPPSAMTPLSRCAHSPAIAELCAKLVDMLCITHTSGLTQTTFCLQTESLRNSPLFGTKITIAEYSTAPKAFNIQICSSAQGVALCQRHLGQLMSALHEGKRTFSVHRLETELLSEPFGGEGDEEQESEER